jgi:cytochrome subunit of sulfide dehydrogenase
MSKFLQGIIIGLFIVLLSACQSGNDADSGDASDTGEISATGQPAVAEIHDPTDEQGAEMIESAAAAEPPEMIAVCDSCHGREAPSPYPDLATIHGLPADAIANALYDFRAGLRPCHKSRCSERGTCPDKNMCEIAEQLSDTEIDTLSDWFAAQEFVSADERYDYDLADQGRYLHMTRCETCHTQGGMVAVEQSVRLRGQHKEYLRNALVQFREGERMATGVMDEEIKALDDNEIEALLDYYASPRH